MKKLILRVLFVVVSVFSVACYGEEGNYDYIDINEIKIEGIADEYTAMFKGEPLVINPIISYTLDDGKDTTRYGYEWLAISEKNSDLSYTISNEKNLNASVGALSGVYTLWYKITDSITGVQWKTNTK